MGIIEAFGRKEHNVNIYVFKNSSLICEMMAKLSKAIYLKSYNRGIPMEIYWAPTICKHTNGFFFPQGKQNIIEVKEHLKFGVMSPGKSLNCLTGLESHFFIKHWIFSPLKGNLIHAPHWRHSNYLNNLLKDFEKSRD